jgi:hypothetical protein
MPRLKPRANPDYTLIPPASPFTIPACLINLLTPHHDLNKHLRISRVSSYEHKWVSIDERQRIRRDAQGSANGAAVQTYVGEWQGEAQLSTGKFGAIEVLSKGPAEKAKKVVNVSEGEQPSGYVQGDGIKVDEEEVSFDDEDPTY